MGKKIITSLFFLALAFVAQAQTVQLKVGGGFASQYSDKKVVGSFKFGVGYEYEFSQNWTINPSLLLTGKGWKDKDVELEDFEHLDENGDPKKSLMGRSTSVKYLELPVLFNYYIRIANSQYIVLGAGPYVSCGLWGKQETKGDVTRKDAEKLYYEDDIFDLEDTRRFDAGIQALVGYQFPMGVTLGLEADFGLAKFRSTGGRNVSGLVSLSYSFRN